MSELPAAHAATSYTLQAQEISLLKKSEIVNAIDYNRCICMVMNYQMHDAKIHKCVGNKVCTKSGIRLGYL